MQWMKECMLVSTMVAAVMPAHIVAAAWLCHLPYLEADAMPFNALLS
jgi:hypothetical protein